MLDKWRWGDSIVGFAPFLFLESNRVPSPPKCGTNTYKDEDGLIFLRVNINKEGKTMKQAVYTKSLTIAVSPEQYAQIKDITDEKHISMGEWVRGAMEAALSNQQQKEGIM